MISNIVFLFIGALIGWLFQRFTDIFSGPNISISLGEPAILLPDTTSQVKFLHVTVKNNSRNFLKRFFVGDSTANNARSWISFLDIETDAELLKINGRWTSTKEPVNYSNNTIDLGYALMTSRETLPINEESHISIVVKADGKSESYAFNNESYLYGWYKPDFALDEKRYKVRIKISSEGKEWTKDFILLNLGKTIKNFRLINK